MLAIFAFSIEQRALQITVRQTMTCAFGQDRLTLFW